LPCRHPRRAGSSAPFGQAGLDQFALDLRTPRATAGPQLAALPPQDRGFPDRGPGSYMAGGTLAQWFDVIIHRQELVPHPSGG